MIVNRLAEHLGAEISDVDLTNPLSDATFADVSRAFFENQVVVFRSQHLTPDQQIAFTRRFGALEQHVRVESRLPGHPEILVVSNVLNEAGKPIGAQDAGRFWHSDLSYKREPSLLSALYALEVPERDGQVLGDTAFASTLAAYDALPDETKQRLEGLKNVHSYEFYRAKNRQAQAQERADGVVRVVEPELTTKALSTVPDVETLIVRVHPVTGRKGLFVNEAHTSRIPGISDKEGVELLDMLYRHIVRPEFIYRHHWRAGDLLMWDNCAVQHKATFDYDLPLRRVMHRTTVRGPAVV